jgi:hypothetical protein
MYCTKIVNNKSHKSFCIFAIIMYSLFDTLTTMHHTKSIDENNPDNEHAYIKNILVQHDTDAITLTTIFDFDIQRSTNDNDNDNCLTLACLQTTNLPIIKYLIEECKMDINHVDQYNNNCLALACMNNTNLAVIKYLIEKCKMNINHVNQYNNNCLALACMNNTNLAIIKYLIEECKMDINHVNQYNNNCLALACLRNTNLAIIKYLIEECKMDINHVSKDNNNCLTLACRENTNLAVIKYLIKEHQMFIEKINHVLYNKFKDIVLTISKEYRNLNNLLLMGYEEYTNDEMKNLIALINPLQLSDTVLNLARIQNPYDYKFAKFTIFVDELTYPLDLNL